MAGLQLKYFVLTPTKDNEYGEASRQAIKTYAKEILNTNLELSEDLYNWIDEIQESFSLIDGSINVVLED